MNYRRNHGPLLFLLAVVIYGGVMFVSAGEFQEELGNGEGWARLERAQARLLLRGFLLLKYLHSGGESSYSPVLDDLLRSAAEGWEKALRSAPGDLQVRFALAVCQQQFGGPAAATLRAAPIARRESAQTLPGKTLDPAREYDLYLLLRTLVLSPKPDADILRVPQVMDFIHLNPTHRLWLASAYSRLGLQKEAEEQWRLGYRESLPYAAAALAILATWWILLPIVGLICAFSLYGERSRTMRRSKRPFMVSEAEPSETFAKGAGEEPSVLRSAGPPGLATQGIGLAEASEGFLAWLLVQFLLAGLFVATDFHSGLRGGRAIVLMISSCLAALVAIGWLRRRSRFRFAIGWRTAPFSFHLRFGLAIFLLAPVGLGLARALQYFFGLESRQPSLLLLSEAHSLPLRVLLLLTASCIVPAAEETIFRGLLFRGLRAQWGLLAGMTISSAIFALGHLDVLAAPPLFIFSLGLAWSVERTGSLLPAAIAHGLFNLFPLLLLNAMTL